MAAGIPVIPSLDGFRAYAVVAIVLYHVVLFSGAFLTVRGTRIGEVAAILPLGVDVLFIISGFVVFLPTVVRGGEFGDVRGYAIRRAARLVPAYWLVLGLIFVLVATVPPQALPFQETPTDLELPSAGAFLGHLAFLHTPIQLFDSTFPGGLGVDGPIWTLSLEIGFYIVLPFIATAYYRHPWRGLLIAGLISLAWHLFFANFDAFNSIFGIADGSPYDAQVVLQSDYQLPAWAFSFGAGMSAAYLFVRLSARGNHDELRRRASLAQPLVLVAVAVTAYLGYRYGIANTGSEVPNVAGIGRRAPIVGIAFTASVAGLILATAFAGSRQQALWSNPLARWMADVSYGIYLIHFIVLSYLVITIAPPQTGTLGAFLIWGALAIVISTIYGYLSARFLERPIRRWAHRYGRRGSVPVE